MIIKEEIYIAPLKLYRNLHIYLPDHAFESDQKYPVIYMFDGHNLFNDNDATYGKSWGLQSYLDEHHKEVIVVGLECNHESNYRLWEFSPYSFNDEQLGQVHQQGKVLMQWMVKKLKPYIDSHYPTLKKREHTAIGGSSMGGLMALYAISQYSHIYSKAICVSPFLDYVLDELLEDLNHKMCRQTKVYISWGSHEVSSQEELAYLTDASLKIIRTLLKQVQVFPYQYVYGTHSEASWEHETDIWINELEI